MTKLQGYRFALAISISVNVLLVTAIWLYIHFAGLLDIVEMAVGFVS